MNEPKTRPKLCPLLSISDPSSCSYCEGDRCALYVPPEHPGRDPEGRCAMTYLASIAHGVRNT